MGQFHFDERAADVAVLFFETLLTHVKGEWAGQPFVLEEWQKDEIIRPLFGWKREDGTRKYRTAYIELPRKNGKSSIAAGIALYLLFADGEPGAEIYSAAGDRGQAAIVFELAKAMVEEQPELMAIGKVYRRTVVVEDTRSSYRVLSADAYTKHGLNAHGVIFDELHVQPNRDLWDTMKTSFGSRRQPILIAITTAGFDRESICWEVHNYARQIEEGLIEDDAFLSCIYGAEEDDDWLDEEVWEKANPNLGVSLKLDYLRAEAEMAKLTPAYQNTFRRLHLNQWTQQETRWIPMEAWDACGGAVNAKLLEGAQCYGGLDLANTSDIASLVLCFPSEPGEDERLALLPFFWIPQEKMVERARKHRVSYEAWVREGLITATEGNVIDYAVIVRDIEELGERYNIREIAFDRWGAFQVSQALDGAGFEMVGFGQGFASMAGPTKELLRLVLDGKLAHGGNAVLRWMADNVVVSQDAAGNLKPNKQKSREKIDGVVAGIMALDRAMRHESTQSVYETRGVLTL